jgi:hypothetical protein
MPGLMMISLAFFLTPSSSVPSPTCTFSTSIGTFALASLERGLSFRAPDVGAPFYLISPCQERLPADYALCGRAPLAPAFQVTFGECLPLGTLASLAVSAYTNGAAVGIAVSYSGGEGNRRAALELECFDGPASVYAILTNRSPDLYVLLARGRAGCPLECARDTATGAVCGGVGRGACGADAGGRATCQCLQGFAGTSCAPLWNWSARGADGAAGLSRVPWLFNGSCALWGFAAAACVAGIVLVYRMRGLGRDKSQSPSWPVFVLVLVLAVATMAVYSLRSFFSASLSALRDGGHGRAKRSAALVYFGRVGHLGNSVYDLRAARLSRRTVEERVITPNSARWTIDTFAHTWDVDKAAEIASLVQPAALAADIVSPSISPMFASIEAALQLLRVYVARNRSGMPYDRLLIVRYDTVFQRDFDLDLLAECNAMYVASWCALNLAAPMIPPSGYGGCWELKNFWADEQGVPDLYFAGSQPALLRVFDSLGARIVNGTVERGKTCADSPTCGHGAAWAGARAAGVPLRRYGLQHFTVAIARYAIQEVYQPDWEANLTAGRPWLRFSRDSSRNEDSGCGTASVCSDGSVPRWELGGDRGFPADGPSPTPRASANALECPRRHATR